MAYVSDRLDGWQPPEGHADVRPGQMDAVMGRTVKSLRLLQWLIKYHELRDGTPLGMPAEQLAQIRREIEQLIDTLDPPGRHAS